MDSFVNCQRAPASFHFFAFLRKSKLVARKQGRYAEKASAGKDFRTEILLCFRRMGRAARAPGHAKRVTPLQRNNPVRAERMACPPGPRTDPCLMVFPRNALACGPGNAWDSIDVTPTWRKAKVVQIGERVKEYRENLRKPGGEGALYFEPEEWEDSDFSSAGIMMPAALSRSSRRASFIFFLSLSAKPSKIFQWDFMAFVLSWFRMACRKV